MWKTINAGKTWTGEKKNKTKNGGFYWVKATIIPVKNDDGYITEFLSIKQNITKSKLKGAKI